MTEAALMDGARNVIGKLEEMIRDANKLDEKERQCLCTLGKAQTFFSVC